jgi:predicted AlkP superfamily phosphohydrolase/phosphomutase
MTRRVVVVGLDGATFDLIEPWAAEGHLPNLARIMREGSHARLRSTFPPMTAPAWTSFATGVNPGKHGLYDWIAREPGSYRFTPVTAADARAPTIYDLLSRAGRRVLLVNVPMTYPPPQVNGWVISGLPAPSLDANVSYPPEALEEARRAAGDYWLYPDPGQAYSDSGVAAFLDRLYRCTVLRIVAFEHMRRREPWDFAMVVFNGTDTVSHATWKYMDAAHPLHDPDAPPAYKTAIRDQYIGMDRYIGRLMEIVGEDTAIVVMSDHGFGPFHAFIHVNRWLIEQGFMRLKRDAVARAKQAAFAAGLTPMATYDLLMRAGLGGLKREVVRGQGQGLLKRLFLSFDDVDWAETVAYSLGNVGQVRINLAGREPAGSVRPEDYARVRDAIMSRLATLRDPATGETAIEAIWPREEMYAGPQLELAAISCLPRRMEYFGFGEYEFGARHVIEPMRHGISGTHRQEGILLAWGPGVRAAGRLPGADITDLAPTLLHLLGLPAPEEMDGRALTEALDPALGAARIAPADASRGGDEHGGLSPEEERTLRERLRGLGYVA